MADKITKVRTREIVDDFAREVRERRMQTVKPSKTVINFRTDIRDGIEREVWRVPIDILRYRKDNGRISSDVLDYETNIGILDERDARAQDQIAKFLEEKDPERTNVLTKSILHAGQLEPAIITCDGFLINGNRRKMVMEKLHKRFPDNENFTYMKVVILPGKDEEGGPPTLLEIEKIENRYQLQSDGKSEYYGFDRALSIKRKIEFGLSLEAQLRDDPRFVDATRAQMKKAVNEFKTQFLKPLECVERYLRQFRRAGLYRSISTGMSDREGRWQAFIDYSSKYERIFNNSKKRLELDIDEDEIGSLEEAAFDMVRLRTIPEMPKIHVVMRNLPKYCSTSNGKQEILKIAEEVDPVLPPAECLDEDGNPLSLNEVDEKWAARNKGTITYHVKKSESFHHELKEKQTPLELLDSALRKLNHEAMDINAIDPSEFKRARKLAGDIKKRADQLESDIYYLDKEYKKTLKYDT